jgi:NAD(P) transhydrogenase subunit alpha
MKFVAAKEISTKDERRIAITPEVAKKLIELGHKVSVEKEAGKEAGFTDAQFEKVGATISKAPADLYKDADVVVRVSPVSDETISQFPKGCLLIGMLKPHTQADQLKALAAHKVTSFSMELMPRITRAQSMDVLSSQSSLSGYKAVIDASSEFGRALPLMMTAAGTIPAARILILGAGVAGLQAIATARRLGAIVSAFDVRSAAKEQVESLGAAFIEVEANETGDGKGGYAKEMSKDYQKAQAEKLGQVLETQDIVITTAQIPGKPAPVLITEAMVKKMKPGSIIIDLAAESGGNCDISEFGKTVIKHHVKIIGPANMASRIPYDASQLYSKNIFNFLKILLNKEGSSLEIDWEDEIVKSTALTHQGKIVHPLF